MPRRPRTLKFENYQKISHAERINLIYENSIHRIPMRQLASRTGVNYNSIRNIVVAYKSSGRTNKKNSKTIKLQNWQKYLPRGAQPDTGADVKAAHAPTIGMSSGATCPFRA